MGVVEWFPLVAWSTTTTRNLCFLRSADPDEDPRQFCKLEPHELERLRPVLGRALFRGTMGWWEVGGAVYGQTRVARSQSWPRKRRSRRAQDPVNGLILRFHREKVPDLKMLK